LLACISCLGRESHHARDSSGRMGGPPPDLHECAMLVGWILKDTGWITLCAPMAFPAAILAFCAEAHLVATSWRQASLALLVHHFADGCWLLGNFVWMLSEFLFEEGQEDHPGRQFPWYRGPLFGIHTPAYNIGVNISRAIFILGMGTLVTFYAMCYLGRARFDGRPAAQVLLAGSGGRDCNLILDMCFPSFLFCRIATGRSASFREMVNSCKGQELDVPGSLLVEAQNDASENGEANPMEATPSVVQMQTSYGAVAQPDQAGAQAQDASEKELVFGLLPPELYLHCFIGPWIAKDFFWTFDAQFPLMFFSVVTIALGIDYVRRYGGELIRAELLWMIGDTIWAYGEVGLDDWKQPPRDVAAMFLAVALANILSGAWRSFSSHGEAKANLLSNTSSESKPLKKAGAMKDWN